MLMELSDTWLFPGSPVVENSTYNPKFNGSNPTTGTGREKIVKKRILSKSTQKGYFYENFFVFRCQGRGIVSL